MLDTILSNEIVTLFAIITSGLLLGQINIFGLTLGSSGVIFTALAFGHFGYGIPDGVGTLGLVLFVYTVGLRAGPTFFRNFVRQGKSLSQLSVVMVAAGALAAAGLGILMHIPVDLVAGIFAGALTSTPGLAAAMERLPQGSQIAVGYGISYPFGVVGIVLFVQLLPRFLRTNLNELSKELEARDDPGRKIIRVLVEIANPAVVGRKLSELNFVAEHFCQIPRVLRGNRLVPISADLTLESGEHVLLVGREFRVPDVVTYLGKESDRSDYIMDSERETRQVVTTSDNVVGKTLADLRLINTFGVTVSRITRHELQFVPRMAEEVQYGDSLNVVGEPANIEKFMSFAGHRARTFDETNLISLGIGVIAGVVLGMISFNLSGDGFALGMSGGPLFVALILGHFGKIGPLVGHLPRASQLLMMEIGLDFFLADAGAKAGHTLIPVVQQYGLALVAAAVVVTITPTIIGYILGRYGLKMNLLQIIGGVCGGMTSTPGLGVITAKTDSDVPVVSYAAAYPVALILMTVFAQALVTALS